jgi:hypothetical protein
MMNKIGWIGKPLWHFRESVGLPILHYLRIKSVFTQRLSG